MEVEVLGPLTVRRDGQRLEFGGPREQAVLACLVIRAGEVVSTDDLVRGVWSADDRPESPVDAVRTSVARLRAVLEPDRPRGTPPQQLRTAQRGYLLDLAPERVDSHQFDDMLGRARTALQQDRADLAAELARESLSLWRGPAYAGLTASPAVAAEAARLEDQRLLAVRTRLEADLALGRHTENVAELDSLARQHPTHERFAVLLMIALYRSDRQTEALDAYLAARERLKAVGVEPGPELKSTQQRVFNHDVALNPPLRTGASSLPAAAAVTEDLRAGHARKWLGRQPRLVVGLVALALVAIAAGIWYSGAPALSDGGDAVYHEFDLEVYPGIQYDLDVPPGQEVVGRTQVPFGSPDYRRLDLYRTVEGPDQFAGVDRDGSDREDFNPVRVMQDRDTAAACRQFIGDRGGKARLETLKPDSKICLVTSEGRPTLLTVLELPDSRDGPLRLSAMVTAP
ncbi:MAG: AfsR/SARP family transcriptional regulator [Pseudonocardiaceae bacterium]